MKWNSFHGVKERINDCDGGARLSGNYNVVCGYKIYQIQSVSTDDLLKISLLSYPLLKILKSPSPQIQSKIMWYYFLVTLKNKYFETHNHIYIYL